MKRLDLTGNRYGRLLVLRMCPDTDEKGLTICVCLCDCGVEKPMRTRSLVHDGVKSCGCLLKWNNPGYKKRIHYHVWVGIKDRCYRPQYKNYKNYGAKGIIMCDEWLNDYWAFHRWMELNNWVAGLQVDRFPNKKGNYEPTNCRLATSKTQQNNRNNNVLLEIDGITKTASEWAQEYGVHPILVLSRVKDGWSAIDALTKPKGAEYGYKKRARNKLGQFS